MRLLLNRDDDTAMERVINVPPRGIGAKTLDGLREQARLRGLTLWRTLEQLLQERAMPARAGNALAGFVALIARLDDETRDMTLEDTAEHVIEASGLLDFHRAEKGDKGEAREENLRELVAAAAGFELPEGEPGTPLQAFLDRTALDAGDYEADAYQDSVQLMTLHSAKGLEFPLVFLTGMEENLFPHKMSLEEPGRLEEERRLCYVGMTRAMERLVISRAESRQLYGSESYNPPSRFLREIPDEYLREVRLSGAVSRPAGLAGQGAAAHGVQLGQRVLHPVFGEGVILHFEGQGPSARVQVNFDEGAKWLVLQYANLEAL